MAEFDFLKILEEMPRHSVLNEDLAGNAQAQRTRSKQLSFLERYSSQSLQDFLEMMDTIIAVSRLDSLSRSALDQLTYEIRPDPDFTAYVGVPGDKARVSLSIGLLHSLEDLFYRLVVNKDFFSFDITRNGARLWNGCQNLWFHRCPGGEPTVRFQDYTPVLDEKDRGPAASCYFIAVPVDDAERVKLARFMVTTSLMWILLHEETHYFQGHLHLGVEKNLFNSTLGMSESTSYAPVSSAPICKALEWHADRDATHGVIDLLYQPTLLQYIPNYVVDHREHWLLRAIMTAIGSTMLLFQRSQYLTGGTSPLHPTPRTRILSLGFQACGPAMSVAKDRFGTKHPAGLLVAGVKASIDDMYTSATLIRGGVLGDDFASAPPKIAPLHDLELLDSLDDAELMSNFLLTSMAPGLLKDESVRKEAVWNEWASDIHGLEVLQTHLYERLGASREQVKIGVPPQGRPGHDKKL